MGRPTKADAHRIAQRRTQAIQLRINGATWKRIAQECGYAGPEAASTDVRRAVEQQTARQDEAATNLRAKQALQVVGDDYDPTSTVDPYVHMLRSVKRAAEMVATLELEVSELDRQQWTHGVTKTVQDPEGGRTVTAELAVSPTLKLYGEWVDRLAKVSRMVIDAGVSERLVEIEAEKGRMVADILRAVFDDPTLGLDTEQKIAARQVAAAKLRALPVGSGAA